MKKDNIPGLEGYYIEEKLNLDMNLGKRFVD